MTAEEFEKSFKTQVDYCYKLLTVKGNQYAPDRLDTDRLHNFRTAARLQNQSPIQSLGGMLAKHTVKLNDMISYGVFFPQEVWDEVITDSMNYLFLLRALIEDDENNILPGGPGRSPKPVNMAAPTNG